MMYEVYSVGHCIQDTFYSFLLDMCSSMSRVFVSVVRGSYFIIIIMKESVIRIFSKFNSNA